MTFHVRDEVILLRPDCGVKEGATGVILYLRDPLDCWGEPVWQVKWNEYLSISEFGVFESWMSVKTPLWFYIWGAP